MTIQRYLLPFLAAAMLAAPQPRSSDAALGAARHLEEAEGNYPAAIEAYKKFLAQYGKNRALAAKALVRMGQCYEKLGDAESRKIYERVVREYPDQKEAMAMARARLGPGESAGRPTGMAARQVWTASPKTDLYGTISPNGRLIPFVNWNVHGDLFLHDLSNGADRRLTNTAIDQPGVPNEYAEGSAFSRDSKQLAYSWFNGKDRYELRTIALQGAGIPEPRRLFDTEDVSYVSPEDWSPDGKWLAVQLHRKDRTSQIALVSIQDGTLRVLKSVEWRGATRILFSPDGKYLAFDLPASDTAEQRDIFVLAIDGSRETPLVVHPGQDVVLGWSPEGKRLLFASDRSGSMGLWSVTVAGERVLGAPELLKPEIGQHDYMGVTSSGDLYSAAWNSGGGPDIRVASFDFASGKFLSAPVQTVQTFVGTNDLPDWSPDGKHLAYASLRGSVGSRYFVLGIRSSETGKVREVIPSPGFFLLQSLVWAPDGRSLLIGGRDAKGREGIFRVDAQTGETSVVVPRERNDGPHFLACSPDGKKLYYRSHVTGQQEFAVTERDLASGNERELIRKTFLGAFRLSPDGRYIAAGMTDAPTKSAAVLLIPISGGEPKELMRLDQPKYIPGFTGLAFIVAGWSPDSRSVLLGKSLPGSGRFEPWLISLGGEQRKLDLDFEIARGTGQLRLHPDGRQIAFQVSGPRRPAEVWVLENFLTTLKAGK